MKPPPHPEIDTTREYDNEFVPSLFLVSGWDGDHKNLNLDRLEVRYEDLFELAFSASHT